MPILMIIPSSVNIFLTDDVDLLRKGSLNDEATKLKMSQKVEKTRLITMRSKPDYVEFVLL